MKCLFNIFVTNRLLDITIAVIWLKKKLGVNVLNEILAYKVRRTIQFATEYNDDSTLDKTIKN